MIFLILGAEQELSISGV